MLSLILSNDSSFSLIIWNKENLLVLFAFKLFSILLRLAVAPVGIPSDLPKLICVVLDRFIGDEFTYEN